MGLAKFKDDKDSVKNHQSTLDAVIKQGQQVNSDIDKPQITIKPKKKSSNKTHVLTMRITEEKYQTIKNIANENGITVSELMNQLADQLIGVKDE